MSEVHDALARCYASARAKVDFKPLVALVLGSGLGNFAQQIEVTKTLAYAEIEDFPVSTAPGHKGQFVFGHVGGVPVVAMQGRVHYYEGYDMASVVLPTRLMGMLGAKALLLTNAAGGVNPAFSPGDFMLLEDHIASFMPSPLRGDNLDSLGVRFPDMSVVYDADFRKAVLAFAAEKGIALQKGVYVQLPGPQFETPAEVRMARALGADATGMSTACEAIAARHMGMRVCGISCISNMAAGLSTQPLSAEEVYEIAGKVSGSFATLATGAVSAMARLL